MHNDELLKWVIGALTMVTSGLFTMIRLIDKRRTKRIDQIEQLQNEHHSQLAKLELVVLEVVAIRVELRDTHNETNKELTEIQRAMRDNFINQTNSIERIYKIMIEKPKS